jgi:hypothetical protein
MARKAVLPSSEHFCLALTLTLKHIILAKESHLAMSQGRTILSHSDEKASNITERIFSFSLVLLGDVPFGGKILNPPNVDFLYFSKPLGVAI